MSAGTYVHRQNIITQGTKVKWLSMTPLGPPDEHGVLTEEKIFVQGEWDQLQEVNLAIAILHSPSLKLVSLFFKVFFITVFHCRNIS